MRRKAISASLLLVLGGSAALYAGHVVAGNSLQAESAQPEKRRSMEAIVKEYNEAMNLARTRINAMTSYADYLNPAKQAEVEQAFARARATIKEMAQQKSSIVQKAQSNYDVRYKTYQERVAKSKSATQGANGASRMGSASAEPSPAEGAASQQGATPQQFLADVSVLLEGREPIKGLYRELDSKTKYLPGDLQRLKELFSELAPRFDLSNNPKLKKIVETHENFGKRYGTTRKAISTSAKALYGSDMLRLSNGSRMDIAGVYLDMDAQIKKIVGMRPSLAERISHSVKSSLAQVGSLNSNIRGRYIDERAEQLTLALQIDPECKAAQQQLARMPELKAEVLNNIELEYDNAKFVVEVKNWGGPLSLNEARDAVEAYVTSVEKEKPLKVGIAGQWQPNNRDLLGRPLDHQIPFYAAFQHPKEPQNVVVRVYSAVTDGAVKAMPIVRLNVGQWYIMRKKNL